MRLPAAALENVMMSGMFALVQPSRESFLSASPQTRRPSPLLRAPVVDFIGLPLLFLFCFPGQFLSHLHHNLRKHTSNGRARLNKQEFPVSPTVWIKSTFREKQFSSVERRWMMPQLELSEDLMTANESSRWFRGRNVLLQSTDTFGVNLMILPLVFLRKNYATHRFIF